MVRNYTVSQEEGQVFGYTCERKGCDLFFWRVWFLHVLVELLPAALVLQTGLGQVDREHTGDSYHACNPSIDQFGWEAVKGQVKTHNNHLFSLHLSTSGVRRGTLRQGDKT